MHPHIGERHTVCAFALRDFVFVVRKDQIRPAAVNVECLAQRFARHRRAFDVPTRPSSAPLRRPRRLSGLGALPQHEVERVALAALDRDALSGAQVVERFARELSVARKLAHRKVDIAALGAIVRLIRQLLLLQQLDQPQHLRHVLGRTRLRIGHRQSERCKILVHVADESLGQLADGFAVFGGAPDDLVLDIGDVANVRDIQPDHAHPALRHVHRHEQACVPQVAVVVHGHPAHVQADAAGHDRLQGLLAS